MNALITTAPPGWRVVERDAAGTAELALELRYPAAWFAPHEQHPDALSIEDATLTRMRGLGLLSTPAQEAMAHDMRPSVYGGCSGSMLSFEGSRVYTECLTTWLLWDDEVVERATNLPAIDADLLAMSGTGGLAPDEPPYRRAWRAIGDSLERLSGSPALRQRWVRTMHDYVRFGLAEAHWRSQPPHADQRPFEDAFLMRTVTIGILPTIVYLEACCGIEVPAALTETATYRQFVQAASVVQMMQNELASLPKDGRKMEFATNLVLRHQRDHGGSLRDACDAMLRIHDQAVQTFDELAEALCQHPEGSSQPRLAAYFDYVRHMETGFGFYHVRAERYTRQVMTEDGLAFQLVLTRR